MGNPGRRDNGVLLAGTAVVVLVVVALAAVVVTHGHRPGRSTTTAASRPTAGAARPTVGPVAALAVLRDWDRARAEAWAAGDVAALRRLYVPGSSAGERDVAMLRAWLDRGLTVTGMAMQVVAGDLREHSGRRIVLVVTDRLVGAVVTRPGSRSRRRLPADGESTRRVELRRVGGRWRVASAQEVPRAAARPAATTASASGSANP